LEALGQKLGWIYSECKERHLKLKD
jgi:hypothetical protein